MYETLKTVAGLGISIAFICGYVFLLYRILHVSNDTLSIKQKWMIAAIFLMTLCFSTYLLLKNRFVYYSDYGNYWSISLYVKNRITSYPKTMLVELYTSICHDSYNKLLPMLMAAPMYLFGSGFVRYVQIVHVLFLLPELILLAKITVKISNENFADRFEPVLREMEG